jgi:hypothetical protein
MLRTELAVGLFAHGAGETAASELRDLLEVRLLPGPADWVTVRAYLAAVTDGLDEDLWTRAAGTRSLSLSAVRRKVSARKPIDIGGGATDGSGVCVDELVSRCDRVVVRGGPGSAKSWLARQSTIRSADIALDLLTEKADLDRVEIPLFALCSRSLSSAATSAPWTALVKAKHLPATHGRRHRCRQTCRTP